MLDIFADSSETEPLWTTAVPSRTANSIREERAARDEDVDRELMETRKYGRRNASLHWQQLGAVAVNLHKSLATFTRLVLISRTQIKVCF